MGKQQTARGCRNRPKTIKTTDDLSTSSYLVDRLCGQVWRYLVDNIVSLWWWWWLHSSNMTIVSIADILSDLHRMRLAIAAAGIDCQSHQQSLLIRHGSVRGVKFGVYNTIRRLKLRNQWKVIKFVTFFQSTNYRNLNSNISATILPKTNTRWLCIQQVVPLCVDHGNDVDAPSIC